MTTEEHSQYFFKNDSINNKYDFKNTVDSLFDVLQMDVSFIKFISWAIPSIGFLGTVRGIGDALGKANEAVSGDITSMTASLGVAFNSTFIALLLSIFLMFIISRLELKQDELIFKLRSKLDSLYNRKSFSHLAYLLLILLCGFGAVALMLIFIVTYSLSAKLLRAIIKTQSEIIEYKDKIDNKKNEIKK